MRPLICVSFHFVYRRLGYLEEVLHTLATFPCSDRTIVVLTNTTDLTEQQLLRRHFLQAGLLDGDEVRLVVERDLAHPHDLTWAHKRFITDEFLALAGRYTHFIYLEDDERLTFENFAYFIMARDLLRPFGLVPAFLRTEWNSGRGLYVNTDNVASVSLPERPFVRCGDYAFISVDNPYCGAFVLDLELAREYVISRSFDRDCSRDVSPWDIRERSAMGLTFEAPPAPFPYRVVTPVSIATLVTPHCAWLAHLPNNYADNPHTGHGKIAMVSLFSGNFSPSAAARSPIVDPPLPKLSANLEAILRPFLNQSVPVTSIVIIGRHQLWAQNGESRNGGQSFAVDDEAVLLRLVSTEDTNLGIAARVPIAASQNTRAGRDGCNRSASLARDLRELSRGLSDNLLIIAPDRMLDEMITTLADNFDFRAVVSLSSKEAGHSGDGNAWKLQRALFDRGLIGLCSVRVANGEAQCFLVSDAIRSVSRLGIGLRGHVTMSSLGSNGRFANMLFQYAYVKLYALRYGLKAATPEWEGKQLFNLDDPSCSGLALRELRFGAFTDDDRALWDIDDPPIDIDLWGYFQEIPECWRLHRQLLRRMFQLPPESERTVDAWRYDVTRGGQRTLVAIHVRRGDYRNVQELPWFRLVPEEWYLAWLRDVWPTLRDPCLFVATDEPEVILPAFQEFSPATLGASELTLPEDVRDFEVLRCADQLAICNSSFSRMAAILAGPAQKCFCPSFERQAFVAYEPWIDPAFWARFKSPPSE